MRTAVNLDPDVHALLRQAMHERGASLRQVLNDAVRTGLAQAAATLHRPFVQRTFNMGQPLVDLTKANALAGELEDLERIAKMRLRR
jgi:hypothetical protein